MPCINLLDQHIAIVIQPIDIITLAAKQRIDAQPALEVVITSKPLQSVVSVITP
ncbi:hypothetical protein D3C78_920890 [compost metagenome]